MCVIFLAYRQHDKFPLILLANRDEFYDRPTAAAARWNDFPSILAGRDLFAGGTWLGVTDAGRFAAVTNYRDPAATTGRMSRGSLVADFLKTDEPARPYLEKVEEQQAEYSGFNLLVGEIGKRKDEIYYFSNRGNGIRRLGSGIYGLSNHLLDTRWPKVSNGTARFAELLSNATFSKNEFFDLLSDETLAQDDELPDTGIGPEHEKLLSPIFIRTPIYGTRSSTVLTIDAKFEADLDERVFV